MSVTRVSPSILPLFLALVAVVTSCASTGGVEPLSSTDSVAKVALQDWSAVEALDVNTRLRVLTRVPGEPEALEAYYGRVMNTSPSFITLELLDRSKRLDRRDIVRVDREKTDVGSALPRSATSIGLALTASSAGTPESYDMSVRPGETGILSPQPNNVGGYHVDALRLVRRGIEEVLRVWNTSKDWVTVYEGDSKTP